jgi:mRNA interferase MazF
MPDSKDAPRRVEPKVTGIPRIRRVYWCNFPKDAQLPEFWKTRPVVILSYRRTSLYGTVTVIPCSTQPQDDNKWAVPLTVNFGGKPQWAICDKPTTLAISRLSPDKDGIKVVKEDEFDRVLSLVLDWLPKPR